MIRALRFPPMLGAQPKRSPSTASSLQSLATRAWARATPPTTLTTATTTTTTARFSRRTFTHASRARTSTPLQSSARPTSWKGKTTAAIEGTIAKTQRRSFNWTWSRPSEPVGGKGAGTSQQPPQESLSLSGRLRKLSREYGWAAAGVYLALSVTDFPFCFLLVRWVGTDRVAEIEHWVTSRVSKVIPDNIKQQWHEWRNTGKETQEGQQAIATDGSGGGDVKDAGWGVEQAQQRNKADASLATQLALAYAIHKSFIFVRVPLTAAITPKVVKVLRSWGWQIGKRKPKAKKTSHPSA